MPFFAAHVPDSKRALSTSSSQPVVTHLRYSGVPLQDALQPMQPASIAFCTSHFDPHSPLYTGASLFIMAQFFPSTIPEHPDIVQTSVLGASAAGAGAGDGPHVATSVPSASSMTPRLATDAAPPTTDVNNLSKALSVVPPLIPNWYRVPSHVAPQARRIWRIVISVSSDCPTGRLS